MKIIVLKNNLKNALDGISRIISNSSLSLPVLKNIIIKTQDGGFLILATNLETAITKNIAGKIVREGEIMVPAAIFLGIINNLPSERLELEASKNILTIRTDNYEAALQAMPVDEFPIIPKISKSQAIIKGSLIALKSALGKVISAAQISDLRPELSGVLFSLDNSSFKLAATDSFRLAEKTISGAQFKVSAGTKFILPLKTAQEIMRTEEDEDISVYVDGKQVVFETKGTEIFSRLIEGQFPDYEPIIPKELETEIVLGKEELLNALRLANSFSSRNNEVRIIFRQGEKAVGIHSSDSLLGESKYLLPAKVKGEAVEVVFNLKYLVDGIKNIDSADLLLGLQGDSRPAMIKSPEDPSGFYIIMPIKPS